MVIPTTPLPGVWLRGPRSGEGLCAQVGVERQLAATLRAMGERRQWHIGHAEAVKERLRRPRGRPERTDESKLEILDYYRAHDIHETVEHFGLAERTVRRYIADAKQMRGES